MDRYQVGKRHSWEPQIVLRLLVFGGPAGLQLLAEAGCFSIIMLQVGRLGELEMAATTLALGLNVLAFVPIIGLGLGLGVIVGQRLTEGRLDLARKSVLSALGVSLVYTSVFAVVLGFFPDQLLLIYAWGTEPERFAAIRPMLLPLLKIIAVYCVLDGLQAVFVGAIKGAGDTLFVLFTTFFVSASAVILGILCQAVWGQSLLLWWYVIAGWVTTMGVAFASRYVSGRWEDKRVIEMSTL